MKTRAVVLVLAIPSILLAQMFTLDPPMPNAGTVAYTNTQLDALESFRTDVGLTFFVDATFVTLRGSNGVMSYLVFQGNGADRFRSLNPEQFLATPERQAGSDFGKPNDELWLDGRFDATTDYGWIPNVYRISDSELLGFVHVEENIVWGTGIPTDIDYAIGIAYSSNNGDNWNYCGHVIQTSNKGTTNHLTNIGGVPYIIVGNNVYVYFNEWTGTAAAPVYRGVSVARANLASVIADARAHTLFRS